MAHNICSLTLKKSLTYFRTTSKYLNHVTPREAAPSAAHFLGNPVVPSKATTAMNQMTESGCHNGPRQRQTGRWQEWPEMLLTASGSAQL
jgi:hypothetical protein